VKPKVFSVCDCPVCPGFGPLLALGVVGVPRLVYVCPACNGAWTDLGPSWAEPSRLSDLAPTGVRWLTERELTSLPSATELDVEPWEPELSELLGVQL
jgi:hypothetical protein